MIRPQLPPLGSQPLFPTTPLIDKLKQDHPLIIMARAIDWSSLIDYFTKFYGDSGQGRPILSIRLMIGLLLLKYIYDLSDEEVVSQWEENIYYQAFTGQETFEQKTPCSSSQMSLFRKRIGEEGCELLLAESVRIHGPKALEDTCIADTTVQEKNITFPTDAKLIMKAIGVILAIGAFLMIRFRCKYVKEIKSIKSEINFSKSKLDADKKIRLTERLRVIGQTLLKTLQKHMPSYAHKYYRIKSKLFVLNKIFTQKKEDHKKVYSVHEPQVNCIAKGKSHKKYEFGNKVSIIVSKTRTIILGALCLKNNPYDGDTLEPAIKQMKKLHNGYKPKVILGDRGYTDKARGDVDGVKIVIPSDSKEGLLPKAIKAFKKLIQARPAVEPIIGHLKSDHRLSRNYLKGVSGDMMNPLLAAAAFNFLKYARVEYLHLHRPPRSLALSIRVEKRKYHGLPLVNPRTALFP